MDAVSYGRCPSRPPADRALRTRFGGSTRIDSTNRYLLDEARARAPEGLVAVADHQTAGRGRRGRAWARRPARRCSCRCCCGPRSRREQTPLVTMAGGVAMADAVERVAGFAPGLKWPNDLVVGDRKLAGILAEAIDGDAGASVVGVGCNVEWHEFPPELAEIATACNLEAGRPVDRDVLLDAFLGRARRAATPTSRA